MRFCVIPGVTKILMRAILNVHTGRRFPLSALYTAQFSNSQPINSNRAEPSESDYCPQQSQVDKATFPQMRL